MKVQFEISREEIESVMQIGGRVYIEAMERPKNRELLNFLSMAFPSAMQQFGNYLRRDDAEDGDEGADDSDRQPDEEPADNPDADASDTSKQAA